MLEKHLLVSHRLMPDASRSPTSSPFPVEPRVERQTIFTSMLTRWISSAGRVTHTVCPLRSYLDACSLTQAGAVARHTGRRQATREHNLSSLETERLRRADCGVASPLPLFSLSPPRPIVRWPSPLSLSSLSPPRPRGPWPNNK